MAVDAHLQKARAFLQDAQLCVDHERYDSAVSRAYYTMFRAAMALLEHYGDVRPGWNHGRLEQALRRMVVSERELWHDEAVDDLKEVYALRVTADYDDRQVTAQEAQTCLEVASRFMTQIERIVSHGTHS